ncbi:MAG: MotA/TolQ/ExbB proton channel family protein [Lentimonas sp.]
MEGSSIHFITSAFDTWLSGGWLMLPLFALAICMYYSALDLLLRLESHFLVRSQAYKLDDAQLETALDKWLKYLRPVLLEDSESTVEVRRRFREVRQEYLPIINRRIRFLAIVITAGPLVGLLGTVTGMLATFGGMVADSGNKFDNMIEGISEALITTQTGLMISIPALVILSFIIQRRNRLVRNIARLEYYNVKIVSR